MSIIDVRPVGGPDQEPPGPKRELAARDWDFVQRYANAKSEVVVGILARAGWVEPDKSVSGRTDPG